MAEGATLTTSVLKMMCFPKPKCSVYASRYSSICIVPFRALHCDQPEEPDILISLKECMHLNLDKGTPRARQKSNKKLQHLRKQYCRTKHAASIAYACPHLSMAAEHGVVFRHWEVVEAGHDFGRIDTQRVIASGPAAVIVEHPEAPNLYDRDPTMCTCMTRSCVDACMAQCASNPFTTAPQKQWVKINAPLSGDFHVLQISEAASKDSVLR